ncbi:MAG: redoxin domain-containing protein [Betaproteobacteria bacterium]|nr:redoxin domain-containing protein [Betaproteobacteria bacterium]
MTRPVFVSALLLSLALSGGASAAATVGQPAPDFSLTDVNGKTVKLADFKGRHVVLEWNNPACPFVKKHYESGNMQSLQNRYDAKDTVWLTINSAHVSNGAFRSNSELKAYIAEQKAAPDAYLPDPQSTVGHAYAAKTTPQMFVINPAGMIVYAGAIDDKPSTELADIKKAKNYVVAALEESRAGKSITVSSTTPYGCHVAYQ